MRIGTLAIDEVRGGVGHRPTGARRTYSSVFAKEGDDAIVAALVAAETEESVLGEAGAQVVIEHAADVLGERTRVVLVWITEDAGEVFADDRVEHRLIGTVPLVGTTTECAGGARRRTEDLSEYPLGVISATTTLAQPRPPAAATTATRRPAPSGSVGCST